MRVPYDVDFFPSAPVIDIQLAVPDEPFTVGPLRALVDTGADASLIPVRFVERLRVLVNNRKYLRSQWGERRMVDVYLLDVGIAGFRLPVVEIIADEQGQDVILGRNVLNQLVITLGRTETDAGPVGLRALTSAKPRNCRFVGYGGCRDRSLTVAARFLDPSRDREGAELLDS